MYLYNLTMYIVKLIYYNKKEYKVLIDLRLKRGVFLCLMIKKAKKLYMT